jgi:hypothetical protein
MRAVVARKHERARANDRVPSLLGSAESGKKR